MAAASSSAVSPPPRTLASELYDCCLMRSEEKIAGFCAQFLKDRGFTVSIQKVENAPPYLIAERRARDQAAPTVLFLTHYDGPSEAGGDRAKPRVDEATGVITGSGIASKAMVLAIAAAVEKAQQSVSYHVRMLVEGEGSSRSSSLPSFVAKNPHLLDCRTVIAFHGTTTPAAMTVALAARGVLEVHMRAHPRPGPPEEAVLRPDPVVALTRAVADLAAVPHQNRLTFLQKVHLPVLDQRLVTEPSLECQYRDLGCVLRMHLVPGQTIQRVREALREIIAQRSREVPLSSTEIEPSHSPWHVDPASAEVKPFITALQKSFQELHWRVLEKPLECLSPFLGGRGIVVLSESDCSAHQISLAYLQKLIKALGECLSVR